MKHIKIKLMVMAGAVALAMATTPAQAQAPVIASFGRNGELVCTNLQPGSTASVVWASSLLGPWTNSAPGLAAVTADTNGAIRVSVPVLSWIVPTFCRVWGMPASPFSAPSNMVWIPAGSFTMGSPTSEALRMSYEVQHTVTLTKGFYMGKYPVTQGQYLAVVGSNPSYFQTVDWNGNPISPDLNRPVEMVSWDDATNYCALLTQADRLAGRIPATWTYRLPTEAEREYACRAGTTTAFHFGNAIHGGMANFDDRYEYDAAIGQIYIASPSVPWLPRTTTVGSYAPNAFGLYDMHGNVWEWCRDWSAAYPGGAAVDPTGPATGSNRVIRGGSWGNSGWYCRAAIRIGNNPSRRISSVGFRAVLAPGQP